ncbi:glucose-6-phosphate exchanger SLC37A2-like isoform X2 [Tigriopus californicus]|uniref:glucose-6-phosphate exchanger SLC37A2-like isoform X2 n=1 Tax=Tigriopus californicus TaxID=6832 RepID=UPI0027DA1456|nr:glucose-6-phosphate exchanger SLC37A2-like isoform X2 [Tigriopus californicus]
MLVDNAGCPRVVRWIQPWVCPIAPAARLQSYKFFILFLTYVAYTCYHMSRKPISVVKTILLNCTESAGEKGNCTSFIDQMNGQEERDAKRIEGLLDTSFLFSYAFFMFISGFVAERVDLRYFLSTGMMLCGLFTMAFGLGKYWEIHSFYYYLTIQVFAGAFQTTGWPGVVTVVAHWFGKGKKGLIFGIWNSHTSIGNILGSLLAGVYVETDWAMSFILPGMIIGSVGFIFWFILVPKPEYVGLDVDSSRNYAGLTSVPTSGPGSDTAYHEQPRSGETTPLLGDSDDNANIVDPNEIEANLQEHHSSPITFWGALKIPGVAEFALCLFFAKLVSYTFLFWLPTFIKENGKYITSENAAYLSTLFDIGGILGGIIAGLASDYTGKSATTCAVMLVLAIPMLFTYEWFGSICPINWHVSNGCFSTNVVMLLMVGLLVNGPYALITTAVSAELGTHPSLRGSSMALATVTSIIDGTGSIGAAIGPYMAGAIPELKYVFYMLMGADVLALILLSRLVLREISQYFNSRHQGTVQHHRFS